MQGTVKQTLPDEKTLTDEERILKALRVPEGHQKQKDNRATFKIELQMGKDRTSWSSLSPISCLMTIHESGRRFHGGGDEKMYWCPYQDCQMPVRTEFFAQWHMVCPFCKKESFRDAINKGNFVKIAYMQGETKAKIDSIKKLPVVAGERFYKLPVQKLAQQIERRWQDLGRDADVYLKYHPEDIRCYNLAEVKKPDVYENAREARRGQMVIYPLHRLQRDLAAGATPWKRFLAFVTA